MQDINLYHLLRFYAKKWALIVSLATLGVIAGFIYNQFIQVPLYKSDATLLVVDSTLGSSSQNSSLTSLINNYVDLFKSRRVIQPVIDDLKLNTSYNDLVRAITATNDKNTEVINVSITNKDAKTSKDIAEGAIASFKNEVAKLYGKDNIQVVDNASSADTPFNVRKPLVLALAAAVGLITSLIALFFVYDFNLSRGIDSSVDNPDSDKPTLRQKLAARHQAWRISRSQKRKLAQKARAQRKKRKIAAKKSSQKPKAMQARDTGVEASKIPAQKGAAKKPKSTPAKNPPVAKTAAKSPASAQTKTKVGKKPQQ